MGIRKLAILFVPLAFTAFGFSGNLEYRQGVLDTVKLLSDQANIDVPQTRYWLVEKVTDLGRAEIIYKMVLAQKNLLSPVLIWFNGDEYIVYSGDNDPYHLKELKQTTSGLSNAEIRDSLFFKGFRKIYISPTKYCEYPIYSLEAVVYSLKKKVEEEIKNPQKRERLLKLISQIEAELKPSTEEEIWELVNPQ